MPAGTQTHCVGFPRVYDAHVCVPERNWCHYICATERKHNQRRIACAFAESYKPWPLSINHLLVESYGCVELRFLWRCSFRVFADCRMHFKMKFNVNFKPEFKPCGVLHQAHGTLTDELRRQVYCTGACIYVFSIQSAIVKSAAFWTTTQLKTNSRMLRSAFREPRNRLSDDISIACAFFFFSAHVIEKWFDFYETDHNYHIPIAIMSTTGPISHTAHMCCNAPNAVMWGRFSNFNLLLIEINDKIIKINSKCVYGI